MIVRNPTEEQIINKVLLCYASINNYSLDRIRRKFEKEAKEQNKELYDYVIDTVVLPANISMIIKHWIEGKTELIVNEGESYKCQN